MLNILSHLVDHLPVGVIVLDAAGRPVIYNRVEELLSGRRREDVLGSDFFREHAFCMNVPAIAGELREHLGHKELDSEADLSFPFPFLATPREVRVRLSSFEANGQPYGLLVIRDVTHERAVTLMRETLSQMIVHDLKNPLAAVVANLRYLESEVRDVADAHEAVKDGLASSQRIESMLVNLLDSSRLETNSFPLARSPVDVRALVTRAISLETAVARSRAVRVTQAEPLTPLVANVDGELVLRVLENLIDNAIRKAYQVTIGARSEGSDVVIEVADDGPGIAPELRAHVFEKYMQVAPGAPHVRGLNRGLGLTFVQQAARAHGGDVEIDASPLGGALFRVRLPVSPVVRTPIP